MLLNIIICEDNRTLRMYYQLIIKDYIKSHPDVDMKIILSTGNPNDINIYLDNNPNEIKFFLLDIEFPDSKVRGIDLATKIRKNDLNAKIVFITTHEELMPMIFERKVEPLDYIAKETGINAIKEKIYTDLDITVERLVRPQNTRLREFKFQIGPKQYAFDIDQINYFESLERTTNVFLHAVNQNIEFPDTLKSISNRVHYFYRAHKSLLINPNNIQSINKSERKIYFKDGSSCDISRRKLVDFSKEHPELIGK